MCVHCRFYGWEPIDSSDSHAITNSITSGVPGVAVLAVSPKNSVTDERDQNIANLEALVREKEAEIGNLRRVVREKETTLNHIYNSHGWKGLLIY